MSRLCIKGPCGGLWNRDRPILVSVSEISAYRHNFQYRPWLLDFRSSCLSRAIFEEQNNWLGIPEYNWWVDCALRGPVGVCGIGIGRYWYRYRKYRHIGTIFSIDGIGIDNKKDCQTPCRSSSSVEYNFCGLVDKKSTKLLATTIDKLTNDGSTTYVTLILTRSVNAQRQCSNVPTCP